MQSIASLMSIGRVSDIGNLEDMDEDDESSIDQAVLQERRNTASKINELASQYGFLEHDNNANPFELVQQQSK